MANPFAQNKTEPGSGFLPEDYLTRKADVRANMICLGLFVVVMFGVASAFLVTNRQWASVKEEHRAINAAYEQEGKKIEQLKSLEAQRASMLDRAEITVALVEKSPRSVLMAALVTSMPEGVTLMEAELTSKRVTPPTAKKGAEVKSLSGSKKSSKKSSTKSAKGDSSGAEKPAGKSGGKSEGEEPPKPQAPKFETMLRLTGVATANEQIADYVGKLKACEMLEAVELTYIKETVMAEMTLRKFQVDAKLRAGTRAPVAGVLAAAHGAAVEPGAEAAPATADAGVKAESTMTAGAQPEAVPAEAVSDEAQAASGISRRSPHAIAKETAKDTKGGEGESETTTAGATPGEEE